MKIQRTFGRDTASCRRGRDGDEGTRALPFCTPYTSGTVAISFFPCFLPSPLHPPPPLFLRNCFVSVNLFSFNGLRPLSGLPPHSAPAQWGLRGDPLNRHADLCASRPVGDLGSSSSEFGSWGGPFTLKRALSHSLSAAACSFSVEAEVRRGPPRVLTGDGAARARSLLGQRPPRSPGE